MATSQVPTLPQQAEAVTKDVKRLLNRDLQEILKSENLPTSGVKSALQKRILERLQDTVTSFDYIRFDELRQKIQKASPGLTAASPANSSSSPLRPNGVNGNSPYSAMTAAPRPTSWGGSSASQSQYLWVNFRPSPFYEIQNRLINWVDLPVMNVHRHTVHAQLNLSASDIDILKRDQSMRIMLYCTSPTGPLNSDNSVNIAFPTQLEIKVNSEAVQANLRGIKKKPGTTKPADITAYVQKRVAHANAIHVTYAGTDKKYAFIVYLVKKRPVEELVERIKNGRVISKHSVLKEMMARANDPDIEATSTVMSLKCPLSAMRMIVPCRSDVCNHNQCFDATSFLQVQEQAPQWSCPTCNKVFKFEALAIDEYVQDILGSTAESVEQVTIKPDGSWRKADGVNDSFRVPEKRKAADAWEYDDLVELHEFRANGSRHDQSSTPQSYAKTPNSNSREPSMPSTAAPSTNGKRSVKEVIDLTLSDDEEERPRPVKRQSTGSFYSQTPQFVTNTPPSEFTPFRIQNMQQRPHHSQSPSHDSGYMNPFPYMYNER